MSLRTALLVQFSRTFHFCGPKPAQSPKILTPNPLNLTNVLKRFKHPVKCWQCGKQRQNITELFCEQCSFIQEPPERNNYFKIFEIQEKFNVDLKQLTSKYRQLQSQLHPDKFSTKSNQEKNISEDFSSLVNKAYNTLQAPLKRAMHLLYLKGEKIDEDHKVADPEFLLEIMELNEEVENANTEDKLKNLKRKNDQELSKIATEIEKNFATEEITKAKQNIIRMKYYNSVSLHINSIMREKGIID